MAVPQEPFPTRLLVAGVGPIPPQQPGQLFAPGLRVWGMARELARAGHPVRLVLARFGQEEGEEPQAVRVDVTPGLLEGPWEAACEETLVVPEQGGWPQLLAQQATLFEAQAAVATTDVMNHALASCGLDVPMWMDFFGDPMAEAQMLALRGGSDQGLERQWSVLAGALARADRVSGCSVQQCAALLGELGAVGRLGRRTVTQSLVQLLRPWVEPVGRGGAEEPAEPPLRGTILPMDAFIVVQTGGFNTWLDVESLFETLERAMAAHPKVHFVATGGAIPGHHQGGFEWFEQQVAASRFRQRYHLLGWVPLARVPRIIAQADLALNLDLPCPEGLLGTRNRLLDWLAAGVPVLSTPGCELALELAEQGYIQLTPHHDPAAAAARVTALAADIKAARQAAGAGARFLLEEQTASVCLRPLLHWALAPKPALDLQAWRQGEERPNALREHATGSHQRWREHEAMAQRLAWLERRLARMEGSRWVRWALSLRGTRDLNADPPPPVVKTR